MFAPRTMGEADRVFKQAAAIHDGGSRMEFPSLWDSLKPSIKRAHTLGDKPCKRKMIKKKK